MRWRNSNGASANSNGGDAVLVAVGGEHRKAGKTALVCAILRGLPQLRWTAVKIGHRHAGLRWSILETRERSQGSDTGRYLSAGAERAFWVQAETQELPEAAAALRETIAGENAIVESNSLVEWVRPDLFLMVLGAGAHETKASALRQLARADAFVRWDTTSDEWRGKPVYGVPRGGPLPAGLRARILHLAIGNDTETDRRPSFSSQ